MFYESCEKETSVQCHHRGCCILILHLLYVPLFPMEEYRASPVAGRSAMVAGSWVQYHSYILAASNRAVVFHAESN